MASFSSTYPSQRPVFSLDAANAGRLDPRMTFTRADTPPTYAAPSAVHYWSNEKHLSSENLLLQSSDFDTTWTPGGIAQRNSGQTDPSGGTDGFEIVEDGVNNYHRLYQAGTGLGGSNYAFTVYAKQNSGTRYLMLTLLSNINEYVAAVFDLAGGTPTTLNGSSASSWVKSATQTSSGNGYYKCTLKLTDAIANATATIHLLDTTSPSPDGYGRYGYTGDGSSSIDVAFASLSTTGATDYNATTTQIHREYAPTLKSVATAGQPRFEYDPSSDGQSIAKGILIEGQSTNLINYSSSINSWATKGNVTITDGAAIGPDGTLSASLVRPTGATSLQHYIRQNVTTVASSSYTFSAYVKPAGYTKLLLVGEQTAYPYTDWANATFTLTGSGSVTTSAGSATITALSDGWYRVTATGTAATTGSYALMSVLNDAGDLFYTSDSYSGIIITGVQFELGSFASSLVTSNSGSTVTRAAESLSVATADIGYTGGPVSVVGEASGVNGTVVTLSDNTDNNRVFLDRPSGNWRMFSQFQGSSNIQTNVTQSGSSSYGKFAARFDTNNAALSAGGVTPSTDTGFDVPVMDKLNIGSLHNNITQLNGTIKRIALYNEALSDTNLQALTS